MLSLGLESKMIAKSLVLDLGFRKAVNCRLGNQIIQIALWIKHISKHVDKISSANIGTLEFWTQLLRSYIYRTNNYIRTKNKIKHMIYTIWYTIYMEWSNISKFSTQAGIGYESIEPKFSSSTYYRQRRGAGEGREASRKLQWPTCIYIYIYIFFIKIKFDI